METTYIHKDGQTYIRSIKSDLGVVDSKNVITRTDMSIVVDGDRIHVRENNRFITMNIHPLSGIKAFDTICLITYIDTYKWDVIVEEYLENKRQIIQ